MTIGKKIIAYSTIVVVLILSIVIYYRYYFVFGEGVKAGELNYIVKKGYLFKTYEGKIIQVGLKSRTTGNVQSNEFEFSVGNEEVADKMMANSGKMFELHYKEYKGALPWRGFKAYVVDSIVSIREPLP
ncbi:hypothetical protein EZ428_22795 [Pedobacter frigiditerrae]|uniref:6-phosphogluconate dehydrogenase n=1 Tax=Pedobacter frigiditerrae TaxID=2530452 RepID=A0A4R0MK91_9SPHI|nr:hypothetical protein [Pedobacter frigiditerrae]TCC87030.1 hypothetical protein EZ428_22795 [Pedobacter frigiditerrae]